MENITRQMVLVFWAQGAKSKPFQVMRVKVRIVMMSHLGEIKRDFRRSQSLEGEGIANRSSAC